MDNSQRSHARSKFFDRLEQFSVAQGSPLAVFLETHQCGFVVLELEEVLSEIKAAAGKPAGAGKTLEISDYLLRRGITDNAAEVPDCLPEQFRLLDGPLVQFVVTGKCGVVPVFNKVLKPGHLRGSDLVSGGFP